MTRDEANVSVADPDIAADGAYAGVGEIAHHFGKCAAIEGGIDIGYDHDIAGAGGKAEIDGGALAAAVCEAQHFVDQALALQLQRHVEHPVRRAVVDNDHLDGTEIGQDRLFSQRLQCRGAAASPRYDRQG